MRATADGGGWRIVAVARDAVQIQSFGSKLGQTVRELWLARHRHCTPNVLKTVWMSWMGVDAWPLLRNDANPTL